MRRLTVLAMATAAFILALSGCGDSATEITGTLPVVTGITVDTLASKGDTITVTWTGLDSTQVDGYMLWIRKGIEGPWTLAATSTTNATAHIAHYAGYYTVTAYKGDNISADTGLPANCKTESITESRMEFTGRPVGYRLDMEGDSLIAGDPADKNFMQDFVVAITPAMERFIYSGNAHPEHWPGGANTRVSVSSHMVAPDPESPEWLDSITYGGGFYLALESKYYSHLEGFHTIPDTLTLSDSLVIDGEYQPVRGVRVFNPNL
ncbi:hypothetical protein CSA37_12365 [Candidatus Fermentibacteria bacterium]|nr:MAG: hypothetical protein CSA37_12365 [Candidatus Fermentibacteria bacterium]